MPNDDGPLGELEHDFLNLPPHHATRWPRSSLEYVGKMFGLVMETYEREPISRGLYLTAVDEYLRHAVPARSGIKGALTAALRMVGRASAAGRYLQVRESVPGHSHLALYRKPVG